MDFEIPPPSEDPRYKRMFEDKCPQQRPSISAKEGVGMMVRFFTLVIGAGIVFLSYRRMRSMQCSISFIVIVLAVITAGIASLLRPIASLLSFLVFLVGAVCIWPADMIMKKIRSMQRRKPHETDSKSLC